jgi:serine/threonine protein kinase
MVHRDIKPSNLMLTTVFTDASVSDTDQSAEEEGRKAVVKILDLGLALLDSGDDENRFTVLEDRDRPMGTAMYMSPEQWKSTNVDIRADIYSLGCTLYHLLSGKPPFWDSDLRPERAHERETLRPVEGPHPIPPEVWQIVERMTAKRREDRFASPGDVVVALAPWTKDRRLVLLIDRAMGDESEPFSQQQPRSDTRVRRGKSDTIARQTPPNWQLPTPAPQAKRRSLWRNALVVIGLIAVASLGWFTLRIARTTDPALRKQVLQIAAEKGAGEISDEIDLRFQRIIELSRDDELRAWMVEINQAPDDKELWITRDKPLQKSLSRWLGSEKANFDDTAKSESWFITNHLGLQVSRSPWSSDSIGQSYAFRDYFHGLGSVEEEENKSVEPISAPHLCGVYRSTSTQRLKVAFSVPIENGKTGTEKKILGVLAMSVDLGEFNVLDDVLSRTRGQEVVLVDLRKDYVDGVDNPKRGLILHHSRAESFEEDQRPVRIRPELLKQVEKVLADSRRAPPQSRDLLLDYEDPLSSKSNRFYWGAVHAVDSSESIDDEGTSGWVVLVQEPAEQ